MVRESGRRSLLGFCPFTIRQLHLLWQMLIPIRILPYQVGPPPVAGKNGLGLGPNATGLALGVLFFGVYYGSAYLTKTWIMANTENPNPPKYFRDIQLKSNDDAPQQGR